MEGEGGWCNEPGVKGGEGRGWCGEEVYTWRVWRVVRRRGGGCIIRVRDGGGLCSIKVWRGGVIVM